MKADLHMHSIYSDGLLSPEELVERCKKEKLDIIALTDHDTIEGVEEIKEYAQKKGIRVIPALELSTYTNKESIHLTCYFKDFKERQQFFIEHLKTAHDERTERMKKMINNVNRELNLAITFEEVKKDHNQLVRPHLARIIGERLNINIKEVFNKYLGNNSSIYVPSVKIDTIKAIKMVKEAGGIVILAHPYLIRNVNPFDIIKEGVDGIEVLYGPVDKEKYNEYLPYAIEHNLLITGGSDFHSDNDYHSPINTANYGGEYLDKFLQEIDKLI